MIKHTTFSWTDEDRKVINAFQQLICGAFNDRVESVCNVLKLGEDDNDSNITDCDSCPFTQMCGNNLPKILGEKIAEMRKDLIYIDKRE